MTERDHILVVDDDREIRTLLADYLEKNGLRVSAARDGNEMQRILGRTHVDLVVLDVMLPGDDGLKLCRELRAKSQVPIIMLTACGSQLDRILGLELGADDYVPKPFHPRELLGTHLGRAAPDSTRAARPDADGRDRLSIRRVAPRHLPAHR